MRPPRFPGTVVLATALLLASAACQASGPRAAPPDDAPAPVPASLDLPGWTVDLVEDFDDLDRDVWRVRDGESYERDLARVRAANVSVEGGVLRVQARKEVVDGRLYTSGDLDTYGRYSLPPYFRAEVRAKVPLQRGMWAAPLWIRPADRREGEIDLVETYGKERNDPRVHQTIHGTYSTPRQLVSTRTPFADLGGRARDWHTYAVEKTPGLIVMFVDGQETARFESGDPAWFDEYFESGVGWSLRISLQVGGTDLAPDATTNWAADRTAMLVDHVRTWVPDRPQ